MFDLVRASILFKVDGDDSLDLLAKSITEGLASVKSDEGSRLHDFEVAASTKQRQIVVEVAVEVESDSSREVEDDIAEMIQLALKYSGRFSWGADDNPNRVHLTQGRSQYAYA